MNTKHTPGPWFWHFDSQGLPSLRTPDRGQLIVMDFARRGMQGATPRFAHWEGMRQATQRERRGGIMIDFAQWYASHGMHPDARLIAAAPDLLAVLQHILRCIPINGFAQIHADSATVADIQAAIDKATGGAA